MMRDFGGNFWGTRNKLYEENWPCLYDFVWRHFMVRNQIDLDWKKRLNCDLFWPPPNFWSILAGKHLGTYASPPPPFPCFHGWLRLKTIDDTQSGSWLLWTPHRFWADLFWGALRQSLSDTLGFELLLLLLLLFTSGQDEIFLGQNHWSWLPYQMMNWG